MWIQQEIQFIDGAAKIIDYIPCFLVGRVRYRSYAIQTSTQFQTRHLPKETTSSIAHFLQQKAFQRNILHGAITTLKELLHRKFYVFNALFCFQMYRKKTVTQDKQLSTTSTSSNPILCVTLESLHCVILLAACLTDFDT